MNLAKRFEEVLKKPRKVFSNVGSEGLGDAILYYVAFTSVAVTISAMLSGTAFTYGAVGFVGYVIGVVFGAGLAALLTPLLIFVPHLFAKMFGGKGKFGNLWKAMLYAATPGMLGTTVSAIPVVGFLASLAATAWTIVLQVIAISAVHRISNGKAVLAYVLSFVVYAAVVAVLAVILGAAMLATMASMAGAPAMNMTA